MSDRDCTRQGHHWHESDGTLFNRTRDLATGATLAVHCCFCQKTVTKTGYLERNPPVRSVTPCAEPATR